MYEKEEHILKVLPPRNCLKKSDWFKIAIHYSYIHMSLPQATTKKGNTITYILFFPRSMFMCPHFSCIISSQRFYFFLLFWIDIIDVLICFILYSFFLYCVFFFHSSHSFSSPKFIFILLHRFSSMQFTMASSHPLAIHEPKKKLLFCLLLLVFQGTAIIIIKRNVT